MDLESVQSWQSNIPEISSIVPTPLRTLIVDDERPARDKLKILLSREPDVKVISECANGAAALAAVIELRPDLLLLDIQLPDIDGFSLLKSPSVEKLPL